MKGLSYRTIWVEYPDIMDLCKHIGAPPTGTRDGAPLYTLPVIQDPAMGVVIAGSFTIAQHLDTAYPATQRVLPARTHALQAAFAVHVVSLIRSSTHALAVLPIMQQLSPRSSEYFLRTREKILGMPLQDVAPEGPVRDAHWRASRAAFTDVHRWMEVNGEGNVFVMGDVPSFADVALASILTWIKRMLGVDSVQWRELMEADGGRWSRLVQVFEKWEVVDEEGLTSATLSLTSEG